MMEPYVIELRPCTTDDRDFLFSLHRNTNRSYVEATFGAWDEEWQRQRFEQMFNPYSRKIITLRGWPVGMVDVHEDADSISIEDLQILPDLQRQGIGTEVIREVTDRARSFQRPVTVRMFKVNPARSLYERMGFRVVDQSETHLKLRREPSVA
jgi:ribosomal protein S18 acetylase RimI-like enzyme